MRRSILQMTAVVLASVVLSAPAEARPRLFRVIGALAVAPLAIIAGAAGHVRTRHYRGRSTRVPHHTANLPTEKRTASAGWIGPVFWPDASGDLFDYVFGQPGGAARFWSYGYDDVLDAMFGAASFPSERQRRNRAPRVAENAADPQKSVQPWQNLCGQPPDRIEEIVERMRMSLQPTPEQTPAFDALKDALMKANARLTIACPEKPMLVATERMDFMASRLVAMRLAASDVLPPLRTLYTMLDSRQKSQLNSVDEERSPQPLNAPIRASTTALGCAGKAGEWPTAQITRRVRPNNEQQMASLERLRLTAASFQGFVASTCNSDSPSNPVDRLEAARKRVNVIRYAVIHIRPALNQFYASLSEAQQARFNSLGR